MMIMKKLLSTVLLGLGITTATFAQFDLGIKGGVNTSAIITDAGSLKDNIEASYNTRTGFVGGVYARFGKKLYLQPEVVLASKGGEIIVDNTAFQVKYNDIDVPILLGFKPLKFLHVVGGPVASLKVSEGDSFKEALKNYTSNPDETFANSTFGYQFGVGVKVLGIQLDVRRQGSLSEISVLNLPNEPKFSQRAQGWQVTASFNIL